MAESDPAPPPASDAEAPDADALRTRRVIMIVLAAMAALAVVVVLIARPWAAGEPGSGATPTDGPTSSTPTTEPSTPPTSPAPGATESPQPVPIESPGVITQGLTAQIIGIEAVDGVAEGPGEVAGPSIRFTVTITNGTTSAVDLTSTVVTVDYGPDRIPAGQLYNPGASPMPTTVAAGSAASGVYVFSIPLDQRGLVNITVDYSVGIPPLVFSGPVP